MAMNATTLLNGLKAITPGISEADAITGWGIAYRNYMKESEVLTIKPLSDSVLASAKSAMETALVGISSPKTALAAATMIVTAITAFWTTALAAGATVWVTTPPLTPLPVVLPTALLTPTPVINSLAAVLIANAATPGITKDAAYTAIVGILHPAGAGGTLTQSSVPPVVQPVM